MRDSHLTGGDDVCEEDQEMNFATFTTAGGTAQFITGAQLPMAKVQQLQQAVATSTGALPQVVGMVGGDGNVQYVRTLDGGATLHPQQLITLPIALPGAKPGDPQQTVQIQVLSPSVLQQQPKYQMQIPIQGLQQGAVLTFAYAPETNDGVQILRNPMHEGVQMVAVGQDMAADNKDQLQQFLQQQMLAAAQPQQIIITSDNKIMNNSINNNNEEEHVIVKEECDEDTNDDSSQGTEGTSDTQQPAPVSELAQYFNKLPAQHTQALPLSLQKFLILNNTENKGDEKANTEIQISPEAMDDTTEDETKVKKKKRYKKKSPKPAKPKPGQVVITTSKDGTPLYCCPECSLVYSMKEQLEHHLVVHKIERRFICGICGAGLKRKEHLERHKLGHNPERPYVCAVCRKGFKRREHLNLHTVIHSGVKTEMCLQCGKGFYRKDHLRKHARSHETKRAREELLQNNADDNKANIMPVMSGETAEITIHVPTSANVQVPVQINIPQHVVSSLSFPPQAAQPSPSPAHASAQAALDALLAQHT